MENIQIVIKATFLMLLAGMVSSCEVIQQAIEKPTVHVKEVKYHSVSRKEGQIDSRMQISNPNSFSLPLRNMTYNLKLNDRVFADSKLAFDKDIPAKGMIELNIPIRFQYGELLHGISSIIAHQHIKFRLEGKLDLGLIEIPFSKTGEFALKP